MLLLIAFAGKMLANILMASRHGHGERKIAMGRLPWGGPRTRLIRPTSCGEFRCSPPAASLGKVAPWAYYRASRAGG